jgi:O-6-methylguanine DNA methyltransferase
MTVLMTDLKRLGSLKAPAGFAGRVLAAAGVGDSYARFDTVLGPVYVAWNRHGVSTACRASSDREFEEWFRREVGRPLRAATPPADLAARLGRELSGERTLRFDLRGLTEFEESVLRKAREIPRGEVRPYSWIAREIGHPAAVRAVGTALAHNPIPFFIPCHRVVRSDGVIGNYSAGGPEAKREILELEGVRLQKLQELARAGYRYEGVRSTKIYCYPTCHHARRALEKNVVWLHDATEARKSGYRPCKVCRPETAVAS